jgi:hypothetical protein
MFNVIASLVRPAAPTVAKYVAGLAAVATTAYVLRRTGGDKRLLEGVANVGGHATAAAVVATGAVIDGGCVIADGAINAATATAAALDKGVETAAYGAGRAARAAADLGSKVKTPRQNPIARGFRAGFYKPENTASPVLAEVLETPVAPEAA